MDLGIFGQQRSINDYLRAEEEFNLRKQQALRASQQQKPAPVQIAEEAERRLKIGDMDGYHRLMDIAKVYDKGIRVNPMTQEIIPVGAQQQFDSMPSQPASPRVGQPVSRPVAAQIGQPAMTNEQRNAAIIDLYGDTPAQPVELSGMGVQRVFGYDEALAAREAAKAGATERAKLSTQVQLKPQIIAAEETEKRNQEKIGSFGKARASIATTADKFAETDQYIQDAKRLSGAWTTGIAGGVGQFIPGTPQYDLAQAISNISSTAMFGALQEMRDNSPTGGALGNTTENELRMLQNSVAALSQSQSKEQFERNLARFEQQRIRSWQRVRDAYEKTYGNLEGFEPPPDVPFSQSQTQQMPPWQTVVRNLRNRGYTDAQISQFLESQGYK